MTISRVLSVLALGLMINTSFAGEFKPLPGQTAVRVCADAHNLPYSNNKLEGFDNKIAAIIGEELGLPVEYYWFPQRIGFGRNTIKKVDQETGKFLCDLAMSIPAERGMYSPTTAYFSSIDALVYRTGEGYEINEISDIAKLKEQGKTLKIGLFDRAVATEKLIKDGVDDQVEYYQMMTGDARINSGRIVSEELASGKIDVAFAWGPIAAFYANQSDVAMKVVPLNELGSDFIFSFGMGVRHQDKAWKDLLNKILEKRKDDVASIIAQYNMPSLAAVKAVTKEKRAPYTVVDGNKVDDKTYVGWRLFNSTCFVCHGKHATGSDVAPNLLKSVEDMSARKFRKKVLSKYFAKVNLDDPDRRLAFLQQISEEAAKGFKMPTWDNDPNIRPHIGELYAYLKARSDGALSEVRPERLEK
ncbi:MAG: quinoprotein dehydrogenase-associated putative ABC transporter substrate-binding protein [Gammaproteobacteria bacterium]|nr:quinoprotein dehydrogenase-associated putative ABC transporter substrate-binding protein [Gammaproteobacteria bacterium]